MEDKTGHITLWSAVCAAGAAVIAGFGILGATLLVGGALGIAESRRAYRPIVRPKPRYDASQGFRARVKIHNKGRVAAKKCAVRVVSVREIRPGGVHRRSDIPTIRLHWQDTGGDLLDIVADDDPGIEVVCADFPHPVARLGPHKIWEGGITLITLRVTGENIRAVQRTFFFSCHHRRYHAGWRWEEWRTPWYARTRLPPLPSLASPLASEKASTTVHPETAPYRVSRGNQYPNYECGQCPFKNLDKSLLVRHLKNDHGIEVDPDSIPDAPNRGVVLIPVPGDIREMGLVDREERLRAWWGAVKAPLNPVDAGLLMKRLSFMYGEHYPEMKPFLSEGTIEAVEKKYGPVDLIAVGSHGHMRGLLRRDIKRAAKQLGVDLGAVLGKSGGEYEESLKALELGDLSVYPPAEQLKRARDHFVDVVAEVETGGARRAKVDEAKDTLLEKSRAYNASGPGYVKDFELIQESLKRLAMPSSFDSEEPSRQESEEEDPGK